MSDDQEWILFGLEADIRQKGIIGRPIEGKEVAVAVVGDRIVAVQRRCPHEGANLDEGRVFAGKAIKCPLHGFVFDLFTGKGLNCPMLHIEVYPVKIENGEVFVKIH